MSLKYRAESARGLIAGHKKASSAPASAHRFVEHINTDILHQHEWPKHSHRRTGSSRVGAELCKAVTWTRDREAWLRLNGGMISDTDKAQSSLTTHRGAEKRHLRRLTDWTLSAFRMSHHSCSERICKGGLTAPLISTQRQAHSISRHLAWAQAKPQMQIFIKTFGKMILFLNVQPLIFQL